MINAGFFQEIMILEIARKLGFQENWVQENLSMSKEKGTIRGLHYQTHPFTETKLVRIITGSVFDVFVDIRKNSPTFGKWGSHILSEKTLNGYIFLKE